MDLGAANKYRFDDETQWHTVPSVPLLDEHTMTNDNGEPIADVDRNALEEIAANNNRKVYETGDPATLILGHTSDHHNAQEKPAQGFVINYKVKPFKRNKDGQVIYALHGDYKLRHNKKHLVEDYPRRSVELWWNKRDIDPIAMLGGSSPERELGVVLRNSRNAIQLNHVSMRVGNTVGSTVHDGSKDSSNQGNEVILFSRRKNHIIETYYIEDRIPTHKYSKRRETNKVSQMSNNGNGRPRRYSSTDASIPTERKPNKYGSSEHTPPFGPKGPKNTPMGQPQNDGYDMNLEDDEEPIQYDELDEDMPGHAEVSADYDGGGEAIPGMGEGEDQDENDPVLAKVFQSKQWNELSSGIGQIKQMLQGIMGGGQGMDDGMGGVPPDPNGMDGGEEMPAPGSPPGMGGQAPPPGAEDMGDEEFDPNEEEAPPAPPAKKPVKMGAAEGNPHSTGMPGASNGYVPTFAKGKKSPSKMSRGTNMPPRTAQRRQPTTLEVEFARLKQQNKNMRIQLSRMKAEADIAQLEAEGVMFGPTPEVADKIKYSRMEELTLAYLHDEDSGDEGEPDTYVKDKIEEMRVCYSRRRPDPVRRNAPNEASVARYSRTQADVVGQQIPEGQDDEAFEDKLGAIGSFEAINEFAELQTRGKMDRQGAIKFCRKKYGIR